MVKHFNVIMAGVISGIVALFTSVLGISGTIIGSVLSSFLYQLLSSYSEERYSERETSEKILRKPKLANEIVYIFPLVVIGIIELIFLLSGLHDRFYMIFGILESAVFNNLFRLMGIGLIILGVYPYFNSNNIHKTNGTVVLIIGVLLLLRGLIDITGLTAQIFYAFFAQFDFIFALFVVIALALVIINILLRSDNDFFKSNEFIQSHRPKKFTARKIDTSHINKDLAINQVKKHVPHISDVKENVYGNVRENMPGNIGRNKANHTESSFGGPSNNGNFKDSNHGPNENVSGNSENLPLYEEEVILVKDPNNPENPIKKRILKRVKRDNEDIDSDNYQDVYVLDSSE